MTSELTIIIVSVGFQPPNSPGTRIALTGNENCPIRLRGSKLAGSVSMTSELTIIIV